MTKNLAARSAVGVFGRLPKINLIKVCTDDSLSGEAKITMHKRVYQYLSEQERHSHFNCIGRLANSQGIVCYSGKMNADALQNDLSTARIDLMLVGTYGQIIPTKIATLPKYGTYNFHPSDLMKGLFPGPDPFGDMIRAGAQSTKVTVHYIVNEGIDSGPVVGCSPSITISPRQSIDLDDSFMYNVWIKALHHRTAVVSAAMSLRLLDEVYETKSDFHRKARIQISDFDKYLDQSIDFQAPLDLDFYAEHELDLLKQLIELSNQIELDEEMSPLFYDDDF
jgi:folate-dependent phosphoribosylglycinamide formyltransferase PurN